MTASGASPISPAQCPQCGTELSPFAIACPGCARLVHADRLRHFADAARAATNAGDVSAALSSWREALALLPRDSKQHAVIAARIAELGQQLSTTSVPPAKQSIGSRATAGAGALAMLVWKLKTLLLGLSKLSTLASMMLSLGVYWTIWGWRFALGLVLSIYVHEMGHVIALRRFGFKATSPMFIPGLGAFIRLRQQVVNAEEDAYIGLAGPIYGLGAALAAVALWRLTHLPIFAAIAGVGAWVNLFNLLPVSTLDGGRGFHAMTRVQKLCCAATVAGAWYFTQDGLLILLALACAYRGFTDKSVVGSKWRPAITYIGLVIVLATISTIRSYAQ